MSQRRSLSVEAISRAHLFDAARSLSAEGHPGPAVVVAQTAVEVGFEKAVEFALRVTEATDVLLVLTGTDLQGRSWTPTSKRLQRLWRSLTNDVLTDTPEWESYKLGTRAVHGFVHQAVPVSPEQAESFIAAAKRLTEHMAEALEHRFPPDKPY